MSRDDEFTAFLKRAAELMATPLETPVEGLTMLTARYDPHIIQFSYCDDTLNLSTALLDREGSTLQGTDLFPSTYRMNLVDCLSAWGKTWAEKSGQITNFRARMIITVLLAETNTTTSNQP